MIRQSRGVLTGLLLLLIFEGPGEAKPLSTGDSGRVERYRRHHARAEVLIRRGALAAALRQLRLARRALDRPLVLYDLGRVHLGIAAAAKPRLRQRHLGEAKQHFASYLRRAPRGRLAALARAGLRDVARLGKEVAGRAALAPNAKDAAGATLGSPAGRAKDLINEARMAYVRGNYTRSVERARRALRLAPNHQLAAMLIGASACYLRDAALAKRTYPTLDASRQALVRTVCNRKGIALE